MMAAMAFPAASPDGIVRDVCNDMVRRHGLKRGLHFAAEALGVSERWARALRSHETKRVSAEVYLRAIEAQRALRLERLATLRREIAELEAANETSPTHLVLAQGSGDGGMAGAASDGAGGARQQPAAARVADQAVTR